METTDETVEPKETFNQVKHELGRTVVGAIAAYAASKVSDRVYDRALTAIRARKAR